jgi:hypothetical protein
MSRVAGCAAWLEAARVGSKALKQNAGLHPTKSECLRFPQRGREGFLEKKVKDGQERTTP